MIKNLLANAGNMSSIPGLGRSPGEGNSNPLQYSGLENPTDRGAWWATVHGVSELDATGQLTLSLPVLALKSPTSWELPGQIKRARRPPLEHGALDVLKKACVCSIVGDRWE